MFANFYPPYLGAAGIKWQIFYFDITAYVPVDALKGITSWSASSDPQRDFLDMRAGEIFVSETDKFFTLLAMKFIGPMTGFTGLSFRSQVGDWGGDRAIVVPLNEGLYLADAGEFGPDIPTGAGSDMAGDAGDLGMGRALVCGILGVHDLVADDTAEVRRVGELIALVGNQDHHNAIDEGEDQKEYNFLSVFFIAKVDYQVLGIVVGIGKPFLALQVTRKGDQTEPDHQDSRKKKEGEDRKVGIADKAAQETTKGNDDQGEGDGAQEYSQKP